MVEIRPFKGIGYDNEKIKDPGLVITPPYDVINGNEREEFYKLSEYNVVRLILGKEKEENGENKYSRAARYFREWQEKGILKRDKKDSIYIYSQTFHYHKKKFTRIGFVSLVKTERPGKGILPHEKTLEKPFKDRLALLNTTRANFGFVFILYDDRQKVIDVLVKEKIESKKPDMDFTDKFGIRHKLWKISDEEFINRLKEEMLPYQCVIADGHHRYKSVLKFKEENPGLTDGEYTLCCFINSFNEGLFVLPIDRFVFNLKDVSIDRVLTRLKEYFDIEEVGNIHELIKKVDRTKIMIEKKRILKNHVFGMYCFLNKKSYFLRLKKDNVLNGSYADKTDVYRKLDVNILHEIVFNKILKISEEDQSRGTYIEYTKGNKRALYKLKDDKYQFAFFLNPPLMREIFLTARSNETMPQKATYFYPKVYSGLVINRLEK